VLQCSRACRPPCERERARERESERERAREGFNSEERLWFNFDLGCNSRVARLLSVCPSLLDESV
jgi:hypothetical protein